MRKERKLIKQLTAAGLSRSDAIQVLTHESLTKPTAGQLLEGMFDASDRKDGGGLIIWLNDIEKDDRYSRWPSTLESVSVRLLSVRDHSDLPILYCRL